MKTLWYFKSDNFWCESTRIILYAMRLEYYQQIFSIIIWIWKNLGHVWFACVVVHTSDQIYSFIPYSNVVIFLALHFHLRLICSLFPFVVCSCNRHLISSFIKVKGEENPTMNCFQVHVLMLIYCKEIQHMLVPMYAVCILITYSPTEVLFKAINFCYLCWILFHWFCCFIPLRLSCYWHEAPYSEWNIALLLIR